VLRAMRSLHPVDYARQTAFRPLSPWLAIPKLRPLRFPGRTPSGKRVLTDGTGYAAGEAQLPNLQPQSPSLASRSLPWVTPAQTASPNGSTAEQFLTLIWIKPVRSGEIRRAKQTAPVRRAQCRHPFLSTSTLKPDGIFGGDCSSLGLQIGQSMPAAPQPQACSPFQGGSGWFSQTHRVPSQRQQIMTPPCPARLEQSKRPRSRFGMSRAANPWISSVAI